MNHACIQLGESVSSGDYPNAERRPTTDLYALGRFNRPTDRGGDRQSNRGTEEKEGQNCRASGSLAGTFSQSLKENPRHG